LAPFDLGMPLQAGASEGDLKVARCGVVIWQPSTDIPTPVRPTRGTFGESWQPDRFGNVKRIPQVLTDRGVVDQVANQVAKSARKLGPHMTALQ
jgi:hypothetical protein